MITVHHLLNDRTLDNRVYALLRTFLHTDLKQNPYETLLCKLIEEILCRERQLTLHFFTAIKWMIARAWKTQILHFEVVKMNEIMVNEKLTAILSDTHWKFFQVCQS